MSGFLVSHVNLQQLFADCLLNGVPGAEAVTTDILEFTGTVSGPPAVVTNPVGIKLYNEYDYYLYEIRAAANFGMGPTVVPGGVAAGGAGGALGYVPYSEAENLTFNVSADGRNRGVFRNNVSFSKLLGSIGQVTPFQLAAPAAFSGAETINVQTATRGTWAGNVPLAWSVTLFFAIVKAEALKELDRKMRGGK
jgi:hypothetical protein